MGYSAKEHTHEQPNPKPLRSVGSAHAPPATLNPVGKANPNTTATKNRPMNGRFWDAKVVVLGFTKNIHPNLLTIYYFTFLVK